MHEVSIVEYAVNAVRAAATLNNMEHVSEIQIKAGVLRGIVPNTMQHVFQTLIRKDSVFSGCKLNIQIIPTTVQCRLCGKITTYHEIGGLTCSCCGSEDTKILGGTELTISKFSGY